MSIFKKRESAAVQFDIDAVVAEAKALPKVVQRPSLRDGAPQAYAEAVVRSVGLWAYQNAAALQYQGDTAESIQAKITEISAKRTEQNRIAGEARLAIHKEVGGVEGLTIIRNAGLSPAIDVDTFARQRAAEGEAARLGSEISDLRPQLHAANQHEAVKREAAQIIAALLSVLN